MDNKYCDSNQYCHVQEEYSRCESSSLSCLSTSMILPSTLCPSIIIIVVIVTTVNGPIISSSVLMIVAVTNQGTTKCCCNENDDSNYSKWHTLYCCLPKVTTFIQSPSRYRFRMIERYFNFFIIIMIIKMAIITVVVVVVVAAVVVSNSDVDGIDSVPYIEPSN